MKINFLTRTGIVLSVLLLSLSWSAQATAALDPSKSFSQYKQIVWNEEKGLPVSLVTTMTQTREGYLWFGTQEGLVRFNGVSFNIFDPKNTPTLKGNLITVVYEDSSGRLWVGTNKGLHLYQNGEFKVYTTENGLAKDFVVSLSEDRTGCLWIGTSDGLNCLKDEKITTFDLKSAIPNGRTRTVGEAANGDLWIGTSEGLARFRNGQFKVFAAAEGFTEKSIRTIYRDRDDDLWIGTDNGLFRFENERFIRDARFDGKIVRSIKNDKNGALWVGGTFGVSRIVGSSIATMESRRELPSGIYSMLEDAEGCFWVATESEGLIQFVDGKFAGYSSSDGLLDDVSYSIFQTGQKDIWISTQKGLNRFRSNAFDLKLTLQNGLPNTRLGAIDADDDGNLWIGTPKGLLRWQNDRLVNVKGIESLSQKVIQVLYRDSENSLWIGSNAGLSVINDQSDEIVGFDQFEQITKANIFVITGSLSKGLWIGTSRGLFFLKNNQLTQFTTKDGLAGDTVMSLFEDESGVLWIGGFGSGLSRLKDNKITSVNTANGLFNDTVFAILPDDRGNLWMSSNRGIFQLTKTSVDEFIDGKRQNVDSIGYGMADGMKSSEANGGFQPAALRANDGKLWFPTVKGVVVIDPNNISTNLKPPPVYIENIFADSVAVPLDKQKQLPAGTQRLEFQFAALSFVAPEKVHYRYRLEGYDADWIDAGNHHEAFYTNLPHGNYNFRVIAANNDGVWNETGTNFAFQINPYMYQTWWFIASCVFAFGALIVALHFRRVRILRLRHEAVLNERYRIARELHDTLLQGFVGVSSQLSVVAAQFQETPEIAERHLKIARNMIRHSVTEARRSVQNLRTAETEGETFTQILEKTVQRVTQGSNLKTEIEINGTPFEMPPEITHHLLQIVEEATVNTIKHAAAETVKVVFSCNAPAIKLEIIDDGKGLDVKNAFSTLNGHFGVIGMMERAEKAGGALRVEENTAGGTKIVFESRKAASNIKSRFAKLTSGFKKRSKEA
jgi:ligand-binding sensor domain-containing protein/signal transduction histidine kinase